jgi:hypothetical protein
MSLEWVATVKGTDGKIITTIVSADRRKLLDWITIEWLGDLSEASKRAAREWLELAKPNSHHLALLSLNHTCSASIMPARRAPW